MKKVLIAVAMVGLFMTSCEKEAERTGAMCNDGTTSTATGSGACSSHGGVDYWLY